MSTVPRLVSPVIPFKPTAKHLHDRHRAHLHEGSGISPEIIAERGYFTVTSAIQLAHMAKSQQRVPGIGIPVYQLGESYTTITRPDDPRREINDEGKEKIIKYEWPAQTGLVLDMLPRYREALLDPSITLCITEGVKKTDAASSQPWGRNAVWLSINGVWGWMDGKDADGNRCLLPDYRKIPLRGRRVLLIPDSDYETNPHVKMAFDEQAKALMARGAIVGIVRFPHADKKMGLDDAIVSGWTWDEIQQAIHWCDETNANAALLQSSEAQRLQREIERLQAYIQEIEATIGNPELPAGERLTLYFMTKELKSQRQQASQEQPAPVLTRIWKIAEESGQSSGVVGRHIKRFERYGVVKRDIRRHRGSCGDAIKTELYLEPTPTIERPFHIKPDAPKNWGGKRYQICACGSEEFVERKTIVCAHCGVMPSESTERLVKLPIKQDDESGNEAEFAEAIGADSLTEQVDESELIEPENQTACDNSSPTTYIEQFDRSGDVSESCHTPLTEQVDESEQPPRLEPSIGSGHRYFVNQEKIDYVLNVKLHKDGPAKTRGYMERVQGWNAWPQHVRRAVERAERDAIEVTA